MIRVLFTASDTASAQMAAALLQHLGGERFESRATGPAQAAPDDLTRAVLAEIGVGLGKWHAEPAAKEHALPWDYLITLDDGAPVESALVGVSALSRCWKVPSIAVPDIWLRLLAARQLRDDLCRLVRLFTLEVDRQPHVPPASAPAARTGRVSGWG